MELTDKIEKSKQLIKELIDKHPTGIYCGHSGGKDSSVVFHLALEFYPEMHVLHNVKKLFETNQSEPVGQTDVNADTLKLFYEYTVPQAKNVIMLAPDKMQSTIKEFGLTCQIDGTRRDECERYEKSSIFVRDGIEVNREELPEYVADGLFGMSFLYPIYDWNSTDVFNYIKLNNIPLSDEYLTDPEYIEWQKFN